MKASVKFRDDDRPLMRAKVPIGVLGLPFQSGLSAGGDPRELRFDLSTAFTSGPALRLSYRPNDPGLPFALSIRAGVGALGSPACAPFTLAAEFNLLSANSGSPAFFLLLKPRLGDFSLSHTLRSSPSPPPRTVGEVTDSEGQDQLNYKAFSLSGNGLAADVAAAGRSGGLGALLSGMRLTTRSMLPLWGRASMRFNWGIRAPPGLQAGLADDRKDTRVPVCKMPLLVINKISIEQSPRADADSYLIRSLDMASPMLSTALAPLQLQGGMLEFSGLRSSSSLPLRRNVTSDDFMSAVSFRTYAVSTSGGYRKAPTEAKLKVAINGFGRIGRNFLRCWHGRGDSSPLEVIAINDTGGVKQASHLLKYDSTLGIFDADVKPVGDNAISVDGKVIKVVSDRNPSNLPWGEMGIDLVIEGTGVFVDRAGAGKHLEAGAKKVLITAPGKGDIPTYVCGVNAELYTHADTIISNASCTTNCLAPFVKVLDQKFGIIKGTMTTTHSYTGDQRLLDASHRDLRRARAAALNIVPTSTGAAKAVALVLPNLKGKLNGIALRVPTPNVSVVDLVVQVSKKTFAEEVNQAFRDAAANELKGILAVCDEPLVSVDFRCSDVSSTIDASLSMVMGDDMVKVIAWYDNEWGYSQRVVDLADLVANQWK